MFYVYAYLDPRASHEEMGNCPFYVGYGSGSRKDFHLKEAKRFIEGGVTSNLFKSRKIISIWEDGLNPILAIIKDGLSKEEAQQLERDLISKLGFAWDGTGVLTNVAAGGLGGDTLSNNPNFLSGKIKFDRSGQKNPMFGRFGPNNPKSKRYKFTLADSAVFEVAGGEEFNSLIKSLHISRNAVFDVIKGRKPHHRGIKIEIC